MLSIHPAQNLNGYLLSSYSSQTFRQGALPMKSVIYFYNNVQGEEEIHEDEEAYQLRVGETVERDGGYWTIVRTDVHPANDLEPLEVVRVYLEISPPRATSL